MLTYYYYCVCVIAHEKWDSGHAGPRSLTTRPTAAGDRLTTYRGHYSTTVCGAIPSPNHKITTVPPRLSQEHRRPAATPYLSSVCEHPRPRPRGVLLHSQRSPGTERLVWILEHPVGSATCYGGPHAWPAPLHTNQDQRAAVNQTDLSSLVPSRFVFSCFFSALPSAPRSSHSP